MNDLFKHPLRRAQEGYFAEQKLQSDENALRRAATTLKDAPAKLVNKARADLASEIAPSQNSATAKAE